MTTATALYEKQVDEQAVMDRTGHKSLAAVRMYKRPGGELQQHISDILQPPPPKCFQMDNVPINSTSSVCSDMNMSKPVAKDNVPSASTVSDCSGVNMCKPLKPVILKKDNVPSASTVSDSDCSGVNIAKPLDKDHVPVEDGHIVISICKGNQKVTIQM